MANFVGPKQFPKQWGHLGLRWCQRVDLTWSNPMGNENKKRRTGATTFRMLQSCRFENLGTWPDFDLDGIMVGATRCTLKKAHHKQPNNIGDLLYFVNQAFKTLTCHWKIIRSTDETHKCQDVLRRARYLFIFSESPHVLHKELTCLVYSNLNSLT